jgi:hypothetical protein
VPALRGAQPFARRLQRLVLGPRLRARTLPGQQGKAALAVEVLNRMIRTAKPVSVRTA